VDFWLDLASTYSYLAAFRIDVLAARADVAVTWRPFTLGPVFAALGWTTSPFNLQVQKGRYMWHDVERFADELGLPFRRPATFPRNSIPAMRVAMLGCERGWGPAFGRAVLRANFEEDRDIAASEVLDELLAELGVDGPTLRAESESPAWRPRLRAQTEQAIRLGIFGAPSFLIGDEMFWGNDRLEQALAWAVRARHTR
jgi:2-hydroxychromene-2-carboxylate isomerase